MQEIGPPRLVHSRFGLHVVEVLEREPGVTQPFEAVRGAVTAALRQQAFCISASDVLLLSEQAVANRSARRGPGRMRRVSARNVDLDQEPLRLIH